MQPLPQEDRRRRAEARWGWVFVSFGLILMAGVLLYDPLASAAWELLEREQVAPPPVEAETPAEPEPETLAPVAEPPAPPEPGALASHETLGPAPPAPTEPELHAWPEPETLASSKRGPSASPEQEASTSHKAKPLASHKVEPPARPKPEMPTLPRQEMPASPKPEPLASHKAQAFARPKPAPPALPNPAAPEQEPLPAAVIQRPAEEPTLPAEITQAKPVRQLPPVVPEGVRNRIVGEIPVDIAVRIGSDGRVTSARPAAPIRNDGLRSYLASRAVEAARQWRYRPARSGGRAVTGEALIRFRFRAGETRWN